MGTSNLFAIDLDATLGALAEANVDLARRFGGMMAARARLPAVLGTDDDVIGARRLAEEAHAFRARCRAARLEDARPLRALAARVAGFFMDMEAEAAQAREEALERLTQAARRRDVGRAGPPPCARHPPDRAAIPTTWEVSAVDRATLDLEALRPFLADAALRAAARAHLAAHGPHALRGAAHAEVARV